MKRKAHKKTVRHAQRRYTVILEPDEPGYHVYCPILPGCHSCGDTIDEAVENIKDAIRLYCEVLAEDGKPVPVEEFIVLQTAINL
jgi:predicted RNase H-like HicB family nuclease